MCRFGCVRKQQEIKLKAECCDRTEKRRRHRNSVDRARLLRTYIVQHPTSNIEHPKLPTPNSQHPIILRAPTFRMTSRWYASASFCSIKCRCVFSAIWSLRVWQQQHENIFTRCTLRRGYVKIGRYRSVNVAAHRQVQTLELFQLIFQLQFWNKSTILTTRRKLTTSWVHQDRQKTFVGSVSFEFWELWSEIWGDERIVNTGVSMERTFSYFFVLILQIFSRISGMKIRPYPKSKKQIASTIKTSAFTMRSCPQNFR